MDKKWLPLTVVLGAAGVAVVTAGLWPDNEEKPPLPQTLCHGALSRETAELIDDGKGGGVSTDEWESKGKTTDFAVFQGCYVRRAAPDDDAPRSVYMLVIEDTRSAPYDKKDSVPLGPGFTGWALPDEAEVTLPAGCAAGMGSTAPYITASLEVPSQEEKSLASQGEKKALVDRDTATRNNATVMREVATKLTKRHDCAA
uniref:Secreted protein n=1 Tax=Streptomyces sp. NBC_01401 TaxID=2903854 RepID=A0AAU3H204_9ACTN